MNDNKKLLKTGGNGAATSARSSGSVFSIEMTTGDHDRSSGSSSPSSSEISSAEEEPSRASATRRNTSASSSHPQPHGASSSWLDASFIILGEILGTGVLGMPKVVANLGAPAGLACIFLFGICGLYSGLLVSRTQALLLKRPDGPVVVHSFGEAAVAIVGPRFGKFTKVAIIINWLLILPYYVMAASKSVMLALEALVGLSLCYYSASAIVCLALFPLMQVQSLARLKGLALASTIAIVLVLSMTVYYVWSEDQALLLASNETGSTIEQATLRRLQVGNAATTLSRTTSTDSQPSALSEAVEYLNALCNVMFAYQGQSMFFEIMGEMRSPASFPRSIYLANIVMISVYSGISALVVWQISSFLGVTTTSSELADAVPGFLPNLLSGEFARTAVTLLLTLHIAVSFLITNQPLSAKLHKLVFQRSNKRRVIPHSSSKSLSKNQLNRCGCSGGRRGITWAIISVGVSLVTYLICNLVPFFADFQAIIGSVMGASIMFGWPTVLFLMESINYNLDHTSSSRRAWERPKRGVAALFHGAGGAASYADIVCCGLLLLVVVPVFGLGGLISSISGLIDHWADYGMPFDCLMAATNQ